MTIPIFGGLLLLLLAVLVFASYKFIPGWNERDFSVKGANWKKIISIAVGTAVATSGVAYAGTLNGAISLSIALVAYLTVIATFTDLKVYKIPADISILAYWIPVPFVLLCFNSVDWFGPITWGVLVLLFIGIALYTKGLGFADIRLLILFGTAFSWWMDPMVMIYTLLAATFLQMLVHLVAPFISLGVKKKKGDNSVWNPETKKIEGALSEGKRRKPQPHVKLLAKVLPARWTAFLNRKKERFHVPFGPALIITYLASALYYALTSDTLPVLYFIWQ